VTLAPHMIAARNRRPRFGVDLWLIVAFGLMVGGCSLFGESKPKATPEELRAQSLAAARECDLAWPPADRKAAVARAKCHVAAWEILRPTMTYPDILDALIAKRIAIAERVEKGELTVAQGNEAATKARAEAVAEEERRRGSAAGQDAGRSVLSTPQ